MDKKLVLPSEINKLDEQELGNMHQFYDKVPVGICVLAYIPPKTKGGDYDFRAVYVNHQFDALQSI